MVSVEVEAIDRLLAATLRGDAAVDPHGVLHRTDQALVVERIDYHGVAGLLEERKIALASWPKPVSFHIQQQAMAGAIWELRHRQLLGELLVAFAGAGIDARLLKGTALAYSLFAVPATRTRGDSDVLIGPADLHRARDLLANLGFERISGDNDPGFTLQEVWSYTRDAVTAHHIDLHWQLLNAPALAAVLPVAECFANPLPLPALCADAWAMNRVAMLVHACIHRWLHTIAPYFVNGPAYFGGDRLIWLVDIHLLAEALSEVEWARFVALATARGIAAPCLDGLLTAQRSLATRLPAGPIAALKAAHSTTPAYLRSRQLGRAWAVFKAIPGLRRKLDFARARTFPPASFIRDKYPRLAGLPLPLLYARRMIDLIRRRPDQGAR
jgi:hypothetical protein